MPTRDMKGWETSIAKVVSQGDTEEIIVRGHRLADLIGKATFAEVMFLMLQGRLPTKAQARVLDTLLVASIEHGIAPPSMIARCYASYGTTIQAAVGAGITAFGDRMGGLGEQLAQLLVERLGSDLSAGKSEDLDFKQIADAIVAAAVASGTRVPGFGIPLHALDPRSPQILDIARQEGIFGPYCTLGIEIEASLARARSGRPVPMNLDGVSAVVALDLGFDWRATRLFLLTPRTVSFAAHYLEEQEQDSTWRHLRASDIVYTGPEPDK